MLAHAATLGATVRRGVDSVEMTPGLAPTVAYRHDGRAHEASCRIVLACDGRESPIRRALSVELRSTPPQVNMAGMLIDGSHDWPAAEQAAGVEDDFHYLIFPQTGGRVRLYGAWDASDSHRFSGQGRERRFLDAFRLTCLPAADVIADATPVGPLAGYPMTDSWTDIVATEGVVLVGDAAGWSDPIIGQGMSVVFRDVRMITDVMTCSSDWSPAAFDGYAQERRERMRRLRFASAGNYLINGFGPDAIARRRRLRDMFAADPSTSPLATVLLGAWVLPEEAYSPEAWAKLLAA